MKKKVLLLAMAGALCCGMGISRADGAISPSSDPHTYTSSELQQQIDASPNAALFAASTAELQAAHPGLTRSRAEYLGLIYSKDPNLPAAENKVEQNSAPFILNAYRRISQNPLTVDAQIGSVMLKYYWDKRNAQGTVQVSQATAEANIEFSLMQTAQNQQLIDQNNKIIDLLTQLVNKK